MPITVSIPTSLAIALILTLISISNGAPLKNNNAIPEASGVSVITADNTRTIRQAHMNASTTTNENKQAYQVTFSGYYNVTATIYLDKNDTNGKGKQWAISTAINFSALNGPLAVAFGNVGTHVTSSTSSDKNAVSANAMGGTVRIANKTAVRIGGISGMVKNGGKVVGTGGDESVRILAQSDGKNGEKSTATASATAAGSGDAETIRTKVDGNLHGAGGAVAAVGTAGQVFRGDTFARGSMRAANDNFNARTHVMANGYGRSNEGGGGNAAVAGPGSSAHSHHDSRQRHYA